MEGEEAKPREVILDAAWGRGHLFRNAVYVAVGAGLVLTTLWGRVSFLLGACLVAAVTCIGIALDVWRFTHHRCGRCHRTLPAPARWWAAGPTGSGIQFTCDDCDVVWATRLSREA
jgi:hypothetical protein